jgi:hypothetical protein
MLSDMLEWRRTDRIAALIAAVVAAEAWHTGWPDRGRLAVRESRKEQWRPGDEARHEPRAAALMASAPSSYIRVGGLVMCDPLELPGNDPVAAR